MNLIFRLKRQSRLRVKQPIEGTSAGFTLIEVLIAMSILVFISFGIYTATLETYKLRDVLGTEGAFYNTIRLSMSIIQRDLSLMYSPVVLLPPDKWPINPAGPPPLQIIPLPGEDIQSPTQFWSPAIDETGLRPARFTGKDNKITFVSLSYNRTYKDTPGSEFAKITYELVPEDKDPDLKGTYVLVKTENANAFGRDDSKDPLLQTYEILHGIKKLSFSYLFREGNTWKTLKSWDSDSEQPRYYFPDLIVLDLEAIGGKNLSFEGKFKFRPEIPLDGLPANL